MADIENPPPESAPEVRAAIETDTGAVEPKEEAAGEVVEVKSPITFLTYYSALSRIPLASFLIAAGSFAIPDVYLKYTGDFKYCSICFILGTSLFLINTVIDLRGARKDGGGTVALTNAFVFVVGALSLVLGSILIYPNLDTSGHPLGQYLFLAGTTVVSVGLLWENARLLRKGNTTPVSFIIGLYSALVGAICYNYGTSFLMPEFLSSYGEIRKGGRFFVTGGVCFMIHAFAVIKHKLF